MEDKLLYFKLPRLRSINKHIKRIIIKKVKKVIIKYER